ncbi:synapse differentiation-inducing gene protein 1-like [Labeo rohita]|uniref:Synapse differentiation-inducing gene protein 1-like n=1 Tax=Labeo rohita TaxID=84645 RepID=A0A498LMF0_LABRO|nr:transmembrane protein 91-like [Labeo rohita]RXN07934.1 synapse differentiation-inducing gene protein 1-like [Labeo rohita]
MNIPPEPTVAMTGAADQPVVFQPVVVQPAVLMTPMPLVTAVPDYLGYSIFTMLCCCFPLGIAATVYSCSTRDANMAGQRELAMSRSRVAFILNNVALGIGLLATTVAIIIRFTASE